MNTAITRTGALTPAQRASVEALVDAVTAHDGIRPLNEQGHFALAGAGHVVHWLAFVGRELVGYGQADRDQHTVQLLVHPEHRRQGVGRALADAASCVERRPSWWAFGNLAGAQGLARQIGAVLDRELLVMERDLVAHPATEEPLPEGVVLRSYRDSDAEALVEVNHLAFADHPEQGAMDLAEFRLRSSEEWFDPAGMIVAVDDETGALLGFHWTKVDPHEQAQTDQAVGEVYVIGVHPDAAGRGIGRALLSAGLRHLQDRGVRRVQLYVEASSARVVKMYGSASFVEVARDASYTTGETR